MNNEDLRSLRKLALKLLNERDALGPNIKQEQDDLATLIEDVRIYEAELEVQNQQLREVNNSLNQYQHYNRLLFDNLPVAVFLLNSTGVILDLNHQALRMGHFANKQEAKRMAFLRLLHENEKTWFQSLISHPPLTKEHRKRTALCTAKHQDIPVELDLVFLDLASAKIGHALVCCRDMSTETTMHKTNDVLNGLLTHVPSAAFAVNRTLEVVFANPALAKALNINENVLINKDIGELFGPSDTAQLIELTDQIFDLSSMQHTTLETQTSTHQTLQWRVFAIRDDDQACIAIGFISTNL